MLDATSGRRNASARLRLAPPVDPRLEMEAFASAIAHDLRTPMNTSRRLLELVVGLHGSDLPPGPRGTLSEVADTLRNLENVLDGLLRLSGAGHRRLDIRPVDVAAVVKDTIQALRRRPTCAEVTFEVDDLPPCHADEELVREVVTNLIENACKYTRGRADRRVWITAVRTPQGITYSVRDNGPGIPQADAARVFQPFERAAHADDPGGSGLGLAIVQRIVQRHNGTVALAQGEGAEIRFTLPSQPWQDRGPGA